MVPITHSETATILGRSLNFYRSDLPLIRGRTKEDFMQLWSCSMQEKADEYGQEVLIAAEWTNGVGEEEREAIRTMENLSQNGFEKLMKENELDAMVTPGWGASTVLAIGGYPAISVPAGYDGSGMPFGICFGGLKGTEPTLIEVAYAFEQASMVRRPPFSLSMEFSNEASSTSEI